MFNIDPLNFSTVSLETYFNDQSMMSATGFFFSAKINNELSHFLVTNWHVITGRNPKETNKLLHPMGAIPNKIRLVLPSEKDENGLNTHGELFQYEKFISLYDAQGFAHWYQHREKNLVDIAVINLGNLLDGFLSTPIDQLATDYDMSIDVGNDVYILGYPLGFSHFANTPTWKKGSIASEPHAETEESKYRIMVDATTRSGMSGSPVIMRYKTHYVTDDGLVKEKINATRFIGVYASRPEPKGDDHVKGSYVYHELGYVYKSRLVEQIITQGIKGDSWT